MADDAPFCPSCGTSAGGKGAGSSRAGMLGVVVGIAVVASALVGLYASGVLRFTAGRPNDPKLQASGSNSDSVLAITKGPNEKVLQETGQKKVMPDDIRRWLEHLEETEKRRMRLASSQISDAVVMMAQAQGGGLGLIDPSSILSEEETPSPTEPVKKDTDAMRNDWDALEQFFLSVPPPAECVAIRDRYQTALTGTSKMMLDILGQLANSNEDPKAAVRALMAMKDQSKELIDRPAIETDDSVAEICAKYDTRKWFSIKGDVSTGPLAPSLPGTSLPGL